MIRRALPAIAAALLTAAPAFAQSTPAPAPVVLPAQPAKAAPAPAAAKPAGHEGCPYKRSYTS